MKLLICYAVTLECERAVMMCDVVVGSTVCGLGRWMMTVDGRDGFELAKTIARNIWEVLYSHIHSID
jgi:hypothetical protein